MTRNVTQVTRHSPLGAWTSGHETRTCVLLYGTSGGGHEAYEDTNLPLALVDVPGRAGKSSLCIWNPGTVSTGFDSCPAVEGNK